MQWKSRTKILIKRVTEKVALKVQLKILKENWSKVLTSSEKLTAPTCMQQVIHLTF